MKILRFLIWIQKYLLNYPDVYIKTVKMFIDNFAGFLSKKEMERYIIQLQIISEITSKQITIDTIVLNAKVKNLDNELNNLKDNETQDDKFDTL